MRTKLTKRRRWTAEEVAPLVAEYRCGKLTQEEYAEQIGVKVGTLRHWLYRRRSVPPGFAAVRLAPHQPEPGAAITIRWPQGIELELPLALGEAALRPWLRELLGPCLR